MGRVRIVWPFFLLCRLFPNLEDGSLAGARSLSKLRNRHRWAAGGQQEVLGDDDWIPAEESVDYSEEMVEA